ncbi:uncharacterized protein LOC105781655 [Gossypium raimondii]|uniref:uncharacterized protein LOC105781655 n=1 Tax=Gossypium raimondii TaxID=29730 RepID=UPI00063ABA3F|nr:uncharacterized protein LOC105781655 [Gossypium raimondii]
MTPDAAIFKSLDRSCRTKVKIGDGHFIKAEGKGDVLICTPIGAKGYQCQISDLNGSKLMAVTMADKSFVVDWTKDLETAYIATTDESKLWYQRLGHANYKSMDQLCRSGLAENFISSVQNQEKFKTAAETETDCKLKTIRSDNRTEYTSAQFQAFYDKAGIKHQLTNTYTPQQNGVSERKNRSLMDMARCLMIQKNFPKTLWAEAVNTAAYIQNRLPTKALTQKTPFEGWLRFKPSLAHLKVFGCICYAHVPTIKRDKLSERARPSVLVGYSTVKKGYRILDPSTNKVSVSRDMVFNEKSCWNWERSEPEAVSEDLATDRIGTDQDGLEMDIDDEPVKGTRPLAEIYERAHIAIFEPSNFEEAKA